MSRFGAELRPGIISGAEIEHAIESFPFLYLENDGHKIEIPFGSFAREAVRGKSQEMFSGADIGGLSLEETIEVLTKLEEAVNYLQDSISDNQNILKAAHLCRYYWQNKGDGVSLEANKTSSVVVRCILSSNLTRSILWSSDGVYDVSRFRGFPLYVLKLTNFGRAEEVPGDTDVLDIFILVCSRVELINFCKENGLKIFKEERSD